ncbi:MAG: hypothetical protein VR72_17835 [Clostridiaceae bacterium BRH_c20a]|nr:MAG: hypothetical protein VR72_17835 [Clostridiaceae bacterium BRH_c20a]
METLLSIILIGIPVIILFIWLNKKTNQITDKKNKEKEERFIKGNIKHEFWLKHISGYPYTKYAHHYFQVKNNNEIYISSFKLTDQKNTISHQIPVENILRIETKTEDQLQKDITIPRILIGGIFAFAKPKKTKIIKQYLYLSYMDSGVQIDCLFEGFLSQDLGKLTSLVNQLRIEKNKN